VPTPSPLDPAAPRTDELEPAAGSLRQLLNVTRRRWPFLLVTVVVAVAVGVALAQRQSDEFEATSSVLLLQRNVGTQLSGLQSDDVTDPTALGRQAQNQADIADSDELAEMAKKAGKIDDLSADQLRGQTDISPSSTSDLLNFKVTASSADTAVDASRAWAEQYVRFRARRDLADVQQARKQVAAQLEKLEGDDDQQGLYEDLRSKDQQLRALEVLQTPNAQVSSLATGATQTQPKTRKTGLLALAVGLLLGIILMFAREAADRRLDRTEDMEDALGTTYLGQIPVGSRLWNDEPRAARALDRYDVLRAEIALQLPATDGAPVVAVTGTGKGDGRSGLTTGLALAWARAGSQVVVLDLDSVGVAQTAALGGEQNAEVVRFMDGEAPFASAISWVSPGTQAATGNGSVGVVAPPAPTANGAPAIGDQMLRRLVDEARKLSDVVLVQTASLTDSGVAVTAALSDAAIVVVRRGEATQEGLTEVRRVLARLLPATLGFVQTDGGA
jgi:capsular polysaccharide biosynthesis protein